MTAADQVLALRALLPQAMASDRIWASGRLDAIGARLTRAQPADRMLAEVQARLERSQGDYRRRAALPIEITYPELPVSARRADILSTLATAPVVVLTGETGSGKTTQLPKLLIEAGFGRAGMIAVTQPRRVAAVAMAARIRSECRVTEGLVAHSVRFDDRASEDTVIRVMTDGLLLAEAARDRDLSRYDAVMVDEAHERSLNIDLLIGLLTLLVRRRPDLKVVIASASIDAERFARHFASSTGPAPIIHVGGRMYPVEIRYQIPADDDIGYLEAALRTIRQIHDQGEEGDILCFLPTERDILDARRRLVDLAAATVVPLFGRLSPGEQQRVFAPARLRKVVLASNIAETSLTIPGIRFVVDTGLARLKRYQAGTRTERLPIEAVSQASCIQRAGRAGRIAAGVCIRLFSLEDFAARPPFTTPEIMRSNLAGVALQCLGMGLGEPEEFPWLDAPSGHAWQQARQILDELGALRSGSAAGGHATGVEPAPLGCLTPLGRHLSAIPADPQVARILLAGIDQGVVHEACTIAAYLSVQDPRLRPLGQEAKADAVHRALAHEAGDLATVLRIWQRYHEAGSNSARTKWCASSMLGLRRMREWADVRHQLWQALRERAHAANLPASGHPGEHWPVDAVHRAVLSGMLGNVLLYDGKEKNYRGAGDRRLVVHPGSALRSGKRDDGKRAPPPAPWLVACEVVETSRLFARMCAPIDPEWVIALAGDRAKRRHRDPYYHAKRRQVVCNETVTWKGLPLRDGRLVPYERIDARAASALFVRQAMLGNELDDVFPVLAANHHVVTTARGLRERTRDPGLAVDDAVLEGFYRQRLGLDGDDPPCVASSDALARWMGRAGADQLRLRLEDLVPGERLERAAEEFPERVVLGGHQVELAYRFVPGEPEDGVTLQLTEEQLPGIAAERLDWIVPGHLDGIVAHYLEQLPKDVRRRLIPLAENARRIAGMMRTGGSRGMLQAAVSAVLYTELGIRVAIDPVQVPMHLRPRLRIMSANGALLYEGRDPAFLASQAAGSADRLSGLKSAWQTLPSGVWPGPCPESVTLHGLTAATALERARDERGLVAARRTVYATPAAAAAWHEDGLDALLEAGSAAELDSLVAAPCPRGLPERCERLFGLRLGVMRRQYAIAALCSVPRGRVREEADFAVVRHDADRALGECSPRCDVVIGAGALALERLKDRLKQGGKSLAQAAVMRTAARHLESLLAPGWMGRSSWSALCRMGDYLEGITRTIAAGVSQPQEAMRCERRVDDLLDLWDEAITTHDPRMLTALGLGRRLRELTWVRDECLLAASDGRPGGAGASDGRLRQGIAELGKILSGAASTLGRVRERLLAVHPAIMAQPAGPAANRLSTGYDQVLGALDDKGIGCDLGDLEATVMAFLDRVAVLCGR